MPGKVVPQICRGSRENSTLYQAHYNKHFDIFRLTAEKYPFELRTVSEINATVVRSDRESYYILFFVPQKLCISSEWTWEREAFGRRWWTTLGES